MPTNLTYHHLLQRFGHELGAVNRKLTTATLNTQHAFIRKTIERVEPLGGKIDRIGQNRALTLQGQQAELARLATDAAPTFGYVAKVEAQLLLDTTTQAARLQAVPVPQADPLLLELRNQEIRQAVPSQPQQRAALFLSAADQNNVALLHAMLTAPFPLVSDEVRVRGLQQRAERLFPQEVDQLRQAEMMLDYVSSVKAQLSSWLVSLGADGKKMTEVFGPDDRTTAHDGAGVGTPLAKVS